MGATSVHRRMDKSLYTHALKFASTHLYILEYYSPLEKNKLLVQTIAWMSLDVIVLYKGSQEIKEQTLHDCMGSK